MIHRQLQCVDLCSFNPSTSIGTRQVVLQGGRILIFWHTKNLHLVFKHITCVTSMAVCKGFSSCILLVAFAFVYFDFCQIPRSLEQVFLLFWNESSRSKLNHWSFNLNRSYIFFFVKYCLVSWSSRSRSCHYLLFSNNPGVYFTVTLIECLGKNKTVTVLISSDWIVLFYSIWATYRPWITPLNVTLFEKTGSKSWKDCSPLRVKWAYVCQVAGWLPDV